MPDEIIPTHDGSVMETNDSSLPHNDNNMNSLPENAGPVVPQPKSAPDSALPEGAAGTAQEAAAKAGPSGEDCKAPGRRPARGVFRFRRGDSSFSRDELILSRIREEQLMDYLRLEQKHNEMLQNIKDSRQKRVLTAFELTVSLCAIIGVIYLLKDNPSVLVNILYIIGIIAVLWLWKNPRDK